ncbi:MAG: sugar phosphate isomerase/epimerase [Phycisphaerales bacterium]|nr:sugar phosphate isomerase/epimerase [Phycisphaerales bacterium]
MAIGSIGVCSWSLKPSDSRSLVESVRSLGLNTLQLALGPLLDDSGNWGEVLAHLGAADIHIASAMFAPAGEDYSSLQSIARTGGLRSDETWNRNLDRAHKAARIASKHHVKLVTFHAGFMPHLSGDPERITLLERLRQVARAFSAEGVDIALETGQESAETLAGVLEELGEESIGVNFDPANMILYGMGEPIEAIRLLAGWVRQVHIKDAIASAIAGEWGREVRVGEGAVRWREFLQVVAGLPRKVDLMIEREGGELRHLDIAGAISHLRASII